MNKYLSVCILLLAAASCKKDSVEGSGPITTEQRNVSDFTRVFVSGSTNVYITKGDHFSVQVKGYSNLIPYLETKKENQSLLIAFKTSANVRNDNTEVFITMPSLTGVSTSGSAGITTTGTFSAADFNASISGSGNISLEAGEADKYLISISGSGKVKSFGFIARAADITINGSGDAEVQVSQNLKANISGSGNIYYKGNPVVDSHVSGSGKLIKQ